MVKIGKIKKAEFYCPECGSVWRDHSTTISGLDQIPGIKEGDECPYCKRKREWELAYARRTVKEADG